VLVKDWVERIIANGLPLTTQDYRFNLWRDSFSLLARMADSEMGSGNVKGSDKII